MQKIVIICGPTGVGKSELGLSLARRFGGEIVSADSQQVWLGFDVGTAKPARDERAEVPHHMVDVADPSERFDAARFVALADDAIRGIAARGRVPFVVGGTGMYLKMLVHGICGAPQRDDDVRGEIEDEMAKRGPGMLHEELARVDPDSAARIAQGDSARIARALEILRITGVPASSLREKHRFGEKRYEAMKIGLDMERAELYRGIEERVDRMMEEGLVGEVQSLLERHDASCQPFAAVGYKEIAAHLRGEISLDEALRLVKQHTRNLAKRQLTWFRADPEIRWFSPADKDSIAVLIEGFLGRSQA